MDYQNRQLVGGQKIKDDYTKINLNSTEILTDLTTLETEIQNIFVAQDLDPNKDVELVDARLSSIYGLFANLGLRLNNSDTLNSAHLALLNTNPTGAHGLIVEEGTFTPFIFGSNVAGTNTYSLQSGKYVRTGKQVTIFFRMILTAKDPAMDGIIRLGGLPFVQSSDVYIANVVHASIPFTTNYNQLSLAFGPSLSFQQLGPAVATTSLLNTNIANNSSIGASLTYKI